MSSNTRTVCFCRRCIPQAQSQWFLHLLNHGCSCMEQMRYQWIGYARLCPCHKRGVGPHHPSRCTWSLFFHLDSWKFRRVELTRPRSGRNVCSPHLCTRGIPEVFLKLHRFWFHNVWTTIVRIVDHAWSPQYGSLQTKLQIWNWLYSSS